MSEEIYIDGKLLKDLKVADLKRACKARNISTSGNKATLVKHLKAAVELDNLKKTALNSEGAVQPNSSIADNSADNDFVKQYLENQRKMLQKQHHRFSSASEAESEDDIPKKQAVEGVGSSLTGAMSPPTHVRQMSREATKTEDQEVSADNKKDEEEGFIAEVNQVSKRRNGKKKKQRASTSASTSEISSPEPIANNAQAKVSTVKENNTDNDNISKNSGDLSIVTLKSVDAEPEQQFTKDESAADVEKIEERLENDIKKEDKNVETAPEKKETACDRVETNENSSMENDEGSNQVAIEETDHLQSKDSKDEALSPERVVESADETEAIDNIEGKGATKDESSADQTSHAKPMEETAESSPIPDKQEEMQQDDPSKGSDVLASTMQDETAEHDEAATNEQESDKNDVSKLQDSAVEISMDASEDPQLHVGEKKEKVDDDMRDVEGVPVISVDTDVLMEEVEELDYDDVDLDKSEIHEQEEDHLKKVENSTKKKRKHIQKEKHQKSPSKSDRSPEVKKQRKLKRSSKDSASAPAITSNLIENDDRNNEIEPFSEEKPSEEEEINDGAKSKKNEEEKKEEEPKGAMKTSRRRISIKKNPLKRSVGSDQPREKKRKWGKSTAVDTSQINISTDSLKNIIEVKQDEIRDAVVDFDRSSDEDKEKNESEEEGEIVEEVIVEEVVPEDQEEKEPAVHHDKRKVVTSDAAKEKPVSESRTVKVREKRALPKPDSTNPSEPPPKRVSARDVISPARLPVSCVVHVSNLVRPFALTQLKQLLNENGNFIPDSFWINNIKSHCFVTYESKDVATKTREALHQLRWPTSNPKKLIVEFSTQEEVDWNKREQPERPVKPHKKKRTEVENGKEAVAKKLSKHDESKPVEREDKREHRDHERQHIREEIESSRRGRERQRSPPPEHDRRHGNSRREHESTRRHEEARGNSGQDSRSRRNLREWDMHKLDQDEEMRRMRQQEQRDASPEPRRRRREEPPKPAPEPPKLLDDLFRKTEATPCIYWLPLTDEQIVERKNEQEKQRAERTKLRREGDDGAETKKQEVDKKEDAVPSKHREESREGDKHRDERRKEERTRENDGRRDLDQSRRRGEDDQSRGRREADQSRGRRDADQSRGRREADQSRGRKEADQSRGRKELDQSRGRKEADQSRGRNEADQSRGRREGAQSRGRRDEVTEPRIRRRDERPTVRREPETKSSKSTQEIRSKQIRRRKPSSSTESSDSDSSSDSSDSSSNSSSSSSSSDSEEESPSRSR